MSRHPKHINVRERGNLSRWSATRATVATIAATLLAACSESAVPTAPVQPTSDTESSAPAFLAAAPVSAARAVEVKGVQTVLLHCWDAASRNALLSALRASNVSRIAIGSAPFLSSSTCSMSAGASRLTNLKALVAGLRASNIAVDVLVHLDVLHAENPGSALPDQFWELWSDLINDLRSDSRVSFYVSASLEDRFSNSAEVSKAFVSMASTLTKAHSGDRDLASLSSARKAALIALASAGRFRFHRSPVNCGDASLSTVTVFAGLAPVAVTHERHGSSPAGCSNSSFDAWSNDGPFVSNEYAGYSERCVSDKNADGCGLSPAQPEISMSSFRATNFSGAFRLLWRPAYNLFEATDASSGGVRTRTFKKITTTRNDGAKSGFDGDERTALLAFLR